ncbi:Alpha/Beta hydrolase protein [Dactylonectria estremocensis]|uniref:Alpha/Beta hydrolase protein n=1 Tax=Dactylonectria estremocensis TaxID=1079267 RepID=A0A9P9J2T2_9HYPO|nr:Alpha/Beta hydrolase protein [Dactylonectria estremocensis]
MKPTAVFVPSLPFFAQLAASQVYPASVYKTGFNSSFTFTPSQIEAAQLDDGLVESVQNVINFDRSQLAFGGPWEDEFYTLPPLTNETGPLKPGQLLKVQAFTDPTAYAIPPDTALSRVMYTTKNFNGTVIPTSGFILWPYTPKILRKDDPVDDEQKSATPRKAPVVIWAHGTSGFFRSQSPSSHRGLWYAHQAPFALAQAGYAVFAPDYAGLGISTSWDGSAIPHQYHASPATAHDTLYGMRAVLDAFSAKLDNNFVVMGHSQGGGVAWAVAEALAAEEAEFTDLVAGYKGSIAASPSTDVFSGPSGFMLPTVAVMLHSIFPSFQLSDWLTPLGVARTKLVKEVEGSTGVFQQLYLTSNDIYKTNYRDTWYVDAFSKLADAGRKDFKGPLLVLQGTKDAYVPYNTTSKSVEETWEHFPDNDLEFLVASGVGHVPVLDATRHIWLQWIEDRLAGEPMAKKGNVRTDLESFMPIEQYLSTVNAFPLWVGLPNYSYLVPLSV